ncbi:MAG: response regulator, partial [Pseudomonadota bacterium]|nr:response regulator [Pseudomonadota bacterium]
MLKNKKDRILIVDDVQTNISILANLLEADHDILVALDGKSCLELAFAENPPDLILLDIMMPEMDGHEVCRRLQADSRTQNIPIIFVSALSETEDERKGLALGAVDYITKPFVSAIVKARVKTQLKLKKQSEQLLQQQHELQKVDKFNSFEVLAGGIAHDFNNLLTSIIGNLDLAMMDITDQDGIYKLLSNATRSSLAARDLVAKFLTISRGCLNAGEELQLTRTINHVIKSMSDADIK